MFIKIIFLFVFSAFLSTETAFVDTLSKCSIKDSVCLKTTYEKIIGIISKTGIPEYDVPPIDPIELKDISLSVAGMGDITLIEGTVSGVKGCHFKKIIFDIEKGRGKNNIACDLTVEGKYKMSSSSPILKAFLNVSSIHGEGNGKIIIEKIILKLDYPISAVKRDGEIYLNCDIKSTKFEYEIGKIKFDADSLYLGNKESSKEVIEIMNANWKFLVDNVGRPFAAKAVDIFAINSAKFFTNVPARYYITEDLTPYVKP